MGFVQNDYVKENNIKNICIILTKFKKHNKNDKKCLQMADLCGIIKKAWHDIR